MVRFDIDPGRTALLIVDMQSHYVSRGGPREIPEARDLIPKLNRLISLCRQNSIPVFFTMHAFRKDGKDTGLFADFIGSLAGRTLSAEGTPGVQIPAELDVKEEDVIIVKQTYSAFHATNLDHILRIQGIDTLIIAGLVLPICVESTTRDARHRNYKVILLSDGCAMHESLPDAGWGTITAEEVKRVVLTIMALRFAEVLTVAEIITRLSCLRSGGKRGGCQP